MSKHVQQMKLVLHFNIDKTIVMRNSLDYNNTDFFLRESLAEMIWGRIEYNKTNESIFKVVFQELEYDRKNIPQQDNESEIMNYRQFLEWKFHMKTEEEIESEEERNKINEEIM